MSKYQNALRYLSLIAIVAAIDLLITVVVLQMNSPKPELLQVIVMGLVIVLGLLLGAQGLGAVADPSRARTAMLIALPALLVNVASMVLAINSGFAVVSVVINAIAVVGFSYCVSAIFREQ